ncbi:MAG: NfeD family protein [Treponema sp.]|nr:NfeD family protein [Treponema sp.]
MADFIISNLPWFWLGVLIVCILIEAFTMALTTVWGGIAAIPLIFIARTGLPFKWQLLIFAILTVVLIVFTRPFAVKKLGLGKNKTNVDTMEGEEVQVTKSITQFQRGEAKARNGVIWTATSEDGTEIPKGTVCIISSVEGNTLILKKKE